MKALCLVFLCLSFQLQALDAEISENDLKETAASVRSVAKALADGKIIYLVSENGGGGEKPEAWSAADLESLVGSNRRLQLGGEAPKTAYLKRAGIGRVLLIENKSTVGTLVKHLGSWSWPFQAADFDQVEKAPKVWLDPMAYDVVIFSSPGWWDNFSNPPSGPSRMISPVAQAARDYVTRGGTAIFIDLAQWDLEKCWPKSVRLGSLGPWQLDKFRALGREKEGKLSLAPEGVVAEKIYLKSKAALFEADAFKYPDGNVGEAFPGYVFPDPAGGAGLVAGFAFHIFDQDDTLAGRARRIFFNLLLASSSSRRAALPAAPASPSVAPSLAPTNTMTETSTLLPSYTSTPESTAVPPTPSFTWTETAAPMATIIPTREPTKTATPIPSLAPTKVPSATQVPALAPTAIPRPTVAPTAAPTAWPTPFIQPTEIPTNIVKLAPKTEAAPSPRPVATQVFKPINTLAPAPTLIPVKVRDAIGCIQSSPEPFGEGGVYVFYCLKHAATITFKVFDAKGKMVYSGQPKFFVSGSHQEFYGGIDQKGAPMAPGRYQYRLEAHYDEQSSEWRQSEFNLKRKKH